MLGALAAGLAAPAAAPACDSTGCLILTRGPGGLLRRGGFGLDLTFRLLDQSRRLAGGRETGLVSRPRVDQENGRLLPGYHNDLEGTDSGLQLEAAYGLARRTNLYVSAPLFSRRSHRIGHGSVVTPYETWGFGDVALGARQSVPLPFAGTAVVAVAVELPTGSHDLLDPFDRKRLDPVLQPGSGSLDFWASGQYVRRIAGPRLDVSLSASYQANGASRLRYRFGDEAIASLGLSRPIGRRLAVTAQGKWIREARDRFRDAGVPSTGARFLYLTAGLRFSPGAYSCYLVGQAPVSSHVNETQLAPRAGLIAGIGHSF